MKLSDQSAMSVEVKYFLVVRDSAVLIQIISDCPVSTVDRMCVWTMAMTTTKNKVFVIFIAVTYFSPCVHGFLEGLYCGKENCYDGEWNKEFSFFLIELINKIICSTNDLCHFRILVLGVTRDSSKVVNSAFSQELLIKATWYCSFLCWNQLKWNVSIISNPELKTLWTCWYTCINNILCGQSQRS